MTKHELAAAIALQLGMPVSQALRAINSMVDILTDELCRTGSASVPHICRVKSIQRKPRIGRNPKTGEVVAIPAYTGVKFTGSKSIRDAVANYHDSNIEIVQLQA